MTAVFPRRELLRIGALSIFAAPHFSATPQLRATERNAVANERRCVFMMLQGGLSHLDTWDPKPLMASDVRGPFATLATRIPGVSFGELLPGSALIADQLCVIRSMHHKFTNHIAGTYVTLTGSTDQPDQDREANAKDFPGPAAVLNHLVPAIPGVPRSISLPNWLSIPGPSNRMPGQYAGFLGSHLDPLLLDGDPHRLPFEPLSLRLMDGMTSERLARRVTLSRQLDTAARLLEAELDRRYDHLRHEAYTMVQDGRLREAMQVESEPPAVRERYGRTRIGQSLLLARRLIELGVQFVGYNAFNQEWDTHGDLDRRYRQILPPVDQAFTALVQDLSERALLDQTMVVQASEFGRTPRINKDAGRDHWPNAYSVVIAGGGWRGGVVHGTTDSTGSAVLEHGVSPADLLATLWHQLGIDPATELRDRQDRPLKLSEGRVLRELLV